MSKKHFPLTNKKIAFSLLGGLTALLIVLPRMLGDKTEFICVAYAILSTLFLAAQFWGFVVSQTRYQESVEEPKYALLGLEEEMPWEKTK